MNFPQRSTTTLFLLFAPLLLLIYSTRGSAMEGENIYMKNSVFTFSCSFYDKNGNLLNKEKVRLHILGGQKKGTTDQFNGRWEYSAYPELDEKITIGITENEKRVFVHQPRYGKYLFTELCNFPSVSVPPYAGLKSKGKITIPLNSSAYGEYQGWKVKTKSKIFAKESVKLEKGETVDTWRIESKSRHKKGKSEAIFYFNEKYGFVKLIFKHFDKSYLIMDLTNVQYN